MGRSRSGSNRVNRGGSWNYPAGNLRAANRNRNSPGNRNTNLGFRCVSSRHRVMGGGYGCGPGAQGRDHGLRSRAATRADEEVRPVPAGAVASARGRCLPRREV